MKDIRKLNCLWLILVAAVLITPAAAQEPDPTEGLEGTMSSPWLKIGVGGRGAGFADAYTAICDDATAIFWNPANLCRVRNTQIFAQYGLWFSEMSQNAVSFTLPMKKSEKLPDAAAGAVTGDIAGAGTSAVGAAQPAQSEPGGYSSWYQQYYDYYRTYYGAIVYSDEAIAAGAPSAPQAPPPGGTIAVGVNLFDYGVLTGRDISGNPTGDFLANSYAAMVSYSNAMGNLGFGITAKMINETIDTEVESTYSADAGISLALGGIRIGAAAQNLMGSIKEYPLPQIIRAGAGLYMGPIVLTGDYVMHPDHAPTMHMGAEMSFMGMLAARAGMVIGGDDNYADGGSGLLPLPLPEGTSIGVGLYLGNLKMDVAYTPFGGLGDTFRASMLLAF